MPSFVNPVVPAGALAGREQPELAAAGGLALRPMTAGDAGWLVEAYSDPDIQRWHLRSFETEFEASQWAEGWAERWRSERDARWAVFDAGGSPVGSVGLRGIDLHEGGAEVSYWVLPRARGAGVASRAVTALLGWAFEDLGLHRVEIRHSVVNLASCRVASRLGFAFEGSLRAALLHQDGWHDLHVHGLLADATVAGRGTDHAALDASLRRPAPGPGG